MASSSVDLFADAPVQGHTDVRVSFTRAQLLALRAVSPIVLLVRDATGICLRSSRGVGRSGVILSEAGVILRVGPNDDASTLFEDPLDLDDLFGPLDARGMPNVLFHIRDDTMRTTPYFETLPAIAAGSGGGRAASGRRSRPTRRSGPVATTPGDATLFD